MSTYVFNAYIFISFKTNCVFHCLIVIAQVFSNINNSGQLAISVIAERKSSSCIF